MNIEESGVKSSIEIGGIIVSSLEFPGKMSLVIFTAGCMLKCPYCHNPGLINGGESILLTEIYKSIDESLDFIDSVVITGGEPLMQEDQVVKILEYSKKLELETKVDTNGFFPEKLRDIIELIDYIALDIKAPFDKYDDVIGDDVGLNVKKSLEVCQKFPDTFIECRTTYVPALMDPEDIVEIAKEINCNQYTIQQFRNRTVLDEKLLETTVPSRDDLINIAELIKPFQKNVKIKTSEFGEEIIK
jgi:pyruvate formate lyase activating enzyme